MPNSNKPLPLLWKTWSFSKVLPRKRAGSLVARMAQASQFQPYSVSPYLLAQLERDNQTHYVCFWIHGLIRNS